MINWCIFNKSEARLITANGVKYSGRKTAATLVRKQYRFDCAENTNFG